MGGVSVAVAIIVGLVSSLVQSIGLTIQRKSHLANSLLPLVSQRPALRRPLWLLGFGIYITSNIFSTIFQLDALPIVILAPLGAVSLIFNALTARVLLGDQFGASWVLGTGLVALGAVLIAVFGVVQESEHGLDVLLGLFARAAFVGFFTVECVVTALVLVAAHAAVWHVQRRTGRIALTGDTTPPTSLPPSNYASPHSPAPIPFRRTQALQPLQPRQWSATEAQYAENPSSSLGDDDIKNVDHNKHPSRFSFFNTKPSSAPSQESVLADDSSVILDDRSQRTLTLCGLAFAACSGTLSGMCLVLAKAAVELLVITITHFRTGEGTNEFARAQTWFLVGGLGVCAILQLVYLNYSLAFASPALICPLAFCFFNLSSIFDGLVFYDQFGRLATYQIVLVSLGVAILLLGVWVVSAIQPAGGVEVGTWAEEESICSDLDIDIEEGGEDATLLGGDFSAEPEDEHLPLLAQTHGGGGDGEGAEQVRSGTVGLFGPSSPSSPSSSREQDPMTRSYPQPQPSTRTPAPPPRLNRVFSDPANITTSLPSPFSPSPSSPRTPLSPSQNHRRSSRSHLHGHGHGHGHRRYGSLIPDLHVLTSGAPGFSIGIGAASPGFALRSGSASQPDGAHHHAHAHAHFHSHGHGLGHPGHGGGREGPSGLFDTVRNDHGHAEERIIDIHGEQQPDQGREMGDDTEEGRDDHNPAEAALRGWGAGEQSETAQGRWWSRILHVGGARDSIKLSE